MISTLMTPAMISPVVAPTSGQPILSTSVLALIVVITFLALVIQKEVTGSGGQRWQRDLARGLNIGIIPLGVASCIIAGVRLQHMYT